MESKFDMALRLLRRELKTGPQPSQYLYAIAYQAGVSRKTLIRAADQLHVIRKQAAAHLKQHWTWRLA